jgi:hypothetical protein
MSLTDEEQARVAEIEAQIEARAEHGGPWPVVLGPVAPERRVYEAVLRSARAAGWDAEFTGDDTLVIALSGHRRGSNGA